MAAPYPQTIPWPTGFSFEFATKNETLKMASGRHRSRPLVHGTLWAGSIAWTFTPDEFQAFLDFFERELKNGSMTFMLPADNKAFQAMGFNTLLLKPSTLSIKNEGLCRIGVETGFWGWNYA